jgi:membrane fusion protein, multidrug efflux system
MKVKSAYNPIIRSRSLFLFLVLFAAGALILKGCYTEAAGKEDKKPAVAPPAPPATPVDAVVVRAGSLKEELEVTGTLIANQQVDIVSELTRRVIRVNVKEGSFVKTGNLLFQLDDSDLQAQLEKFRQQEKLAQLNEERLKDLIEHDAIVQQDYDEAFTNLKVLQAQIAELQVMIGKTRITAPFEGQIGMINVHPGAIVSVNKMLTNIEDNSAVKVEFAVPEKYSHVILPGSTHTFTIASDKKEYTARVSARGASLNSDTRTLLVRAIAQNPDRTLLPGQSARLNLSVSNSENAITISSQALIPSSLGYSVFKVRNNVVAAQPVEIGQRSAGKVEIVKGLVAGDTVITSNLLRLGPGSPVKLVSIN